RIGWMDLKLPILLCLRDVDVVAIEKIDQHGNEGLALGGEAALVGAQSLQQIRTDHLQKFTVVAIKNATVVTGLEVVAFGEVLQLHQRNDSSPVSGLQSCFSATSRMPIHASFPQE